MGGWGGGGAVGAYVLSAEVLDEVGVVQDLPGQLLLLLRGLEDQAPLAEPHDVLLHQVQVDQLHELLRGQGRAGLGAGSPRSSHPPHGSWKPRGREFREDRCQGKGVHTCVCVCSGWVCAQAC